MIRERYSHILSVKLANSEHLDAPALPPSMVPYVMWNEGLHPSCIYFQGKAAGLLNIISSSLCFKSLLESEWTYLSLRLKRLCFVGWGEGERKEKVFTGQIRAEEALQISTDKDSGIINTGFCYISLTLSRCHLKSEPRIPRGHLLILSFYVSTALLNSGIIHL